MRVWFAPMLLLVLTSPLLALECELTPLPGDDGLAICISLSDRTRVYSARVFVFGGTLPRTLDIPDPIDATSLYGSYACEYSKMRLEVRPLGNPMTTELNLANARPAACDRRTLLPARRLARTQITGMS